MVLLCRRCTSNRRQIVLRFVFTVYSNLIVFQVLAWGIIGPATVSTGLTFGLDLGEDNRVAYTALQFKAVETGKPSPRYWLLWPGVLMLVHKKLGSFIEYFCYANL